MVLPIIVFRERNDRRIEKIREEYLIVNDFSYRAALLKVPEGYGRGYLKSIGTRLLNLFHLEHLSTNFWV